MTDAEHRVSLDACRRLCDEVETLLARGATWSEMYILRFGTWEERAKVLKRLEKQGHLTPG